LGYGVQGSRFRVLPCIAEAEAGTAAGVAVVEGDGLWVLGFRV